MGGSQNLPTGGALDVTADWQTTVQAIAATAAVLFLAGTLAVSLYQLRRLSKQVDLTAAENRARVRPWVGLTGIHLLRRGREQATDGTHIQTPPRQDVHRIFLKFNNIGSLPASDLRLDIRIEQIEDDRQDVTAPELIDIEIGTVFPTEQSERIINAGPGTYLEHLVGELEGDGSNSSSCGRSFKILGTFRYRRGQERYHTTFKAEFDAERDVFRLWSNLDAS
jgi:hypothetical protein